MTTSGRGCTEAVEYAIATEFVLPFAQRLNGASSDSDGRAAYGQFADANGLLHIKLVTSKREYTYCSYHIQNVNAYISRLKRWMRRFNGVATRYLDNYRGWWRMIDRMGETLTPLTCIDLHCLRRQREMRTEPSCCRFHDRNRPTRRALPRFADPACCGNSV